MTYYINNEGSNPICRGCMHHGTCELDPICDPDITECDMRMTEDEQEELDEQASIEYESD